MTEQPTITQADRDAAAAYWKASMIGSSMTQKLYKSGEFDSSLIVQAFARHRTTSLAAQDGLDDHFPSGLRQRSHQIATAGDVVDGPVCVDCHCGASFSATDEGEARQLWASHAMAAMERPKTAAQDGLVEALQFYANHLSFPLNAWVQPTKVDYSLGGDGHWPDGPPIPSSALLADQGRIARKALSAIKEQHHD